MTKKLKIYQIGLIVSTVVCIGLMLAMGIIAVQKSMKLNLGFQVNPSFECKIVYNGNTIFCNTTKNGESLVVGDGVSLNGNNLTLNQNFSGLGAEFTLTIHNYTALKTEISVSGTGANGNTLTLDAYSSGTAPNGNITITATGTSATLTFAEWVPPRYTLTYNSNGGSGSMESSEFEEGVPQPLSENEFINKGTYYCKQFLGWSEDPNATKATYTNGQSITISQDTTLYAVWDYVWTIKAYNQTNVTTGYNSNFAGYYYVEMGEYPQTYVASVSGAPTTSTSGTIHTDVNGDRYYFQNRIPYYDASGRSSTYYTDHESGWYKFEPIKWLIIGAGSDMSGTYGTGATVKVSGEVPSGDLMLISELALYATQFDHTNYTGSSSTGNNRYYTGTSATTSDIYYSINGGFGSRDGNYGNAADAAHIKTNYFAKLSGLESYFTTYINQTTIAKTTYYSNGSDKNQADNTSHYIFPMGGYSGDSYYVSTYLTSNAMRQAYSSDFAKATSVLKSTSSSTLNYSYWWLRSGYYIGADRAYYVYTDGNVINRSVYYSSLGVRPSFVLNLT